MSSCDDRDWLEWWIGRRDHVEQVLFAGSAAIPDRFGAAAVELWRFGIPRKNKGISQNREIGLYGSFQIDLRRGSLHVRPHWIGAADPVIEMAAIASVSGTSRFYGENLCIKQQTIKIQNDCQSQNFNENDQKMTRNCYIQIRHTFNTHKRTNNIVSISNLTLSLKSPVFMHRVHGFTI